MNPLEPSFYVAIYPVGRIVEKHLTRKEATQYCDVFNRTLPSTLAWANYHPEQAQQRSPQTAADLL